MPQALVHATSQSSSGSMIPHQAPSVPPAQHSLPPPLGSSSSFHHPLQPGGIPSAPTHSSAPSSAGGSNYHHHHHHHHHQAAAMLTLAVSNPPAQMPHHHQHHHHQQNINLNVNHHLISAPIVVDFSNMTVNCQQQQQQQPPSLVGAGHGVGPMGNNGGGPNIMPGNTGGRLK
nr:uncharacterized histidine-rich protein DDB_G0274557-like [Aedes albopictus]